MIHKDCDNLSNYGIAGGDHDLQDYRIYLIGVTGSVG
jgi:hypothetical protein